MPLVDLSLTVSEELLPRFCLLAGSGVTILARTGCSVQDLLCGQLEISPEYLDKRIQTIFLDSRVVGDLQLATVAAGSTVALSAAMPGIAGAMLRKGSPYAAMRSRISHADRAVDPPSVGQGPVVIKLFNMLQRELGPSLLARGVQVTGKSLADLLHDWPETARRGILTAQINKKSVAADVPFETDWTDQDVFLQVSQP